MFDWNKILQLAMKADPLPVWDSMQKMSPAGNASDMLVMQPQAPQVPQVPYGPNGMEMANILGLGPKRDGQTGEPAGRVPLEDAQMRLLQQMLPQQTPPHYAPSAGVGRGGGQVQFNQVALPPAGGGVSQQQIPSLAALLTGQPYRRF